MNEKNSNLLIESCPIIYRDFSYFECDDGWYSLIFEISEYAEKIANLIQTNYDGNICVWQPRVIQVKEKFGGLRFYIDYIPEEYSCFNSYLRYLEAKSFLVCEFCGKDGKPRRKGRGWIKTTCDLCVP